MIKPCTSEFMLADTNGLGMRRCWFPTIVAERFLESTRDGKISRSPDPVAMIDGDLTWFNATGSLQDVTLVVQRAPRTIVAQSPPTVVIQDAWSHQVGVSPNADYPSVQQDSFGGRMQIDRPSAAAADLLYGRLFSDSDASQTYVHIGVVPPEHTLQFRYLAAVQTPGTWTNPSEYEPRWEAHARWTRLLAMATPGGPL